MKHVYVRLMRLRECGTLIGELTTKLLVHTNQIVQEYRRSIHGWKLGRMWEEAAVEILMEVESDEPLPQVATAGLWDFERSSGHAGYRCQRCGTWEYANKTLRCPCDDAAPTVETVVPAVTLRELLLTSGMHEAVDPLSQPPEEEEPKCSADTPCQTCGNPGRMQALMFYTGIWCDVCFAKAWKDMDDEQNPCHCDEDEPPDARPRYAVGDQVFWFDTDIRLAKHKLARLNLAVVIEVHPAHYSIKFNGFPFKVPMLSVVGKIVMDQEAIDALGLRYGKAAHA